MIKNIFGRNRNNERGQSMVEFALAIPIFLTLCLVIIEVGWIGYKYITFDYSYRVSSWELSVDYSEEPNYTIGGSESERYILNELKKRAIGLDFSNIDIKNSSITLSTERKDKRYPDGNSSVERRIYMNIVGEISYVFKPLTPIGENLFGKNITVTKRLDKLRLLEVKS
ncbi:MAG: TadE/TadG family type IV pilus assembly protein [Peptoniphilaceae bacterium]|uniref:TadE/TadG family type IV pilus assembly protein n=1 Tax=Parvimonas sp. TaxID=1944660 RepID=UPI0025FC0DB3|nr:TadE/TadG family type IV pilus assembly protein [Parvimonas sp.]MCI5997608.1 pilus assembly protein [Parvimonas sp.]MDD7765203.1 TadE/TadG family type IV pilus assembly protein [Peptoniphilaceae bacterium]MDY3051422.1 TadE/TadG family type IV pilus assembly protein [Parvimonas sp.]